MSVVILSTGSYVPSMRVTNEELAKRVDTTDEWIRSHSGIGSRHFAADGQMTSDLAVDASRKALEKAGVAPEDLDLIVLSTATPDYFGFPSTACIVQDKLGATNAAALDINAGCTGFIYALDVANSMLQREGRKRALVIGAETLSRIVDWEERSTCVLFGDGAGVVVLERDDSESTRGILHSWLRARGSGADALYLRQAKRDSAFTRDGDYSRPVKIEMDGKAVYIFAVKAITDVMENLLAQSGLNIHDFRWVVPHQANARIVQAAAKRFGLADDRFYMNIEEFANTSTASVPLAMDEMVSKGLLEKGDLVMTMGFGAGLTYGGNIIRW
ncbi:MAG: ketoacyl-ACP synthase III [Spirochaetales bacterium]|nr:MAG: ketoacyl-ACP synthase III [Spirochaetales bacterium]